MSDDDPRDWVDRLDKDYEEAEAADPGADSFDPIPDKTVVDVVVIEQKYDEVGENATSVCKATFEVTTEKYIKKRIWHDFWLTEPNLTYLKRDLGLIGWEGKKLSALMNKTDTSLLRCAASVTVGIEKFKDRNGNDRTKNVIKYFNERADGKGDTSEEIPF